MILDEIDINFPNSQICDSFKLNTPQNKKHMGLFRNFYLLHHAFLQITSKKSLQGTFTIWNHITFQGAGAGEVHTH